MGNTCTMPSFYYRRAFDASSKCQFNPSNLGKGMEKLLDNDDNRLTLVMSTDEIMVGSVIKKAKLHAKSLLTSTNKTVLPTITTQVEAQEEAN
jgi:hypothetical protein